MATCLRSRFGVVSSRRGYLELRISTICPSRSEESHLFVGYDNDCNSLESRRPLFTKPFTLASLHRSENFSKCQLRRPRSTMPAPRVVAGDASTKLKQDALDIYSSALKVVDPRTAVARVLNRDGDLLRVGNEEYFLSRNVVVAAFGKAVVGMVRAVEDAVGDHVLDGVASVRYGIVEALKENGLSSHLPKENSRIKLIQGGKDNLADENSNAASLMIHDIAKRLRHQDLLIVLISGGGSRLLSAPCPPITIEEQNQVTRLLYANGATSTDVNAMRRHTSLLKGGRLARLAAPARVLALIVSETPGDALDIVASGPTAPDPTTPRHCLDLIKAFNVESSFPVSVEQVLRRRLRQLEESRRPLPTPLASSFSAGEYYPTTSSVDRRAKQFTHVNNVLVATARDLCQAAEETAESIGYHTFVLTTRLTGEATSRGVEWGRLAAYASYMLKRKGAEPDKELVRLELSLVEKGMRKETAKELGKVASAAFNSGQGLCIISAGSLDVSLKPKGDGAGFGGPSQQLALSAAIELDALKTTGRNVSWHKDVEIAFLCLATDGLDGPGHGAAGVFVDDDTIQRARRRHLDPLDFLRRHDAFTFFQMLGQTAEFGPNEEECQRLPSGASRLISGWDQARSIANHLYTGVTGTGVGDFHVLLIRHKSAMGRR